MFNDDDIAAAQIAQIFGSELLKAQQSARTDSGSTPQFVKIDPKQFLIPQQQTNAIQQKENSFMLQQLQREAEAACPLPAGEPSTAQLPPRLPTVNTQAKQTNLTIGNVTPIQNTDTVYVPSNSQALERIANSLEQIVDIFQKLDFSIKKKKTRRLKKINESLS